RGSVSRDVPSALACRAASGGTLERALGLSAPVLSISGLRLSRGATEVLKGVDLSLERSELVALMGPSGCGKTTILRAVTALEPFQAGAIRVDGVPLSPGRISREAALGELRRKVGLVFQLHCLFDHLSVLDNVTLAPIHALRHSRSEAEARAQALLEGLGVAARAGSKPRELSGGEAQRVAIARALAVDPPLLLMDEPTASLDPARRNELGDSLATLTAQGRTLLLATHDVDFARDYATRVVVLSDGAVAEDGPTGEVLEHPRHPATVQLLQSKGKRSSSVRLEAPPL
ncbi:MAG: amino acid ABC transporter ATP-binding protein, partial [Thermoanaerobaculia bacterium]